MSRSSSPAKSASSPGKASRQRTAKVLRALDDLQAHDYTILRISEPIISSASAHTNNKNVNADDQTSTTAPLPRTSDVSTTSSLDAPTPASLAADLAHYRELFAKLRFSYVEQVTKEKFIRAIVGDPPLIVAPQDIADLEARNAEAKAALKKRKIEVEGLVAELETRARELAGRYERVREEGELVRELPGRIREVEERVGGLKAEQARRLAPSAAFDQEGGGDGSGRPEMNLPLGRTLEVVEGRRRELAGLERQLEALGGQVPRKRKEMERLRAEVAALENRKANSAAAAREAKRRRENAQGGVEDELEARGRWYRASEMALRRVLEL